MSDSKLKCPGEVWWADHPWLSRVEFWRWNEKITPHQTNRNRPTHVRMECKSHPVLILAPGDEENRGYLVCYLSSQSLKHDVIKRYKLGKVISQEKDSYFFCMAPCYCSDEFIWGKSPLTSLPSGGFEFVKGYLKRACRAQPSQTWECFDVKALEEEVPQDKIEEVRACIRMLIDAIQLQESSASQAADSAKETSKDSDDCGREFDGAVQE